MEDSLTIDTARAAAIFEHPRSRRVLLALVTREQSLQELAHESGLSLSLLHYHIGRLYELGLIEIASKEKRPGRPVKRYRSVARAFFVPSGLAARTAGEALSRELRSAIERDRAWRDDTGTVYCIDETGEARMRRVSVARSSGAFEVWMSLSLSPRDAKDLGDEIRALLARYAKPGGGDARSVLAYCAFAERA